MNVVVALHGAAALLLIVAGAAKAARPTPAAELLGALGLSARPGLARLLGVAEATAGTAALVLGGRTAAVVVACLYAAFAAAVVRALQLGAESCGCFGRVGAPPSRIHVVGNLALAAVSLRAAAAGEPPAGLLASAINESPLSAAALVLAAAAVAGLCIVAFTALPEALHARHGSGRAAGTFSIEPGSLGALAPSSEGSPRRS